MIGTLPPEAKMNWPEHVATQVHAYKYTKSNATGFSPYFLMYGCSLMLPIDIEFGVKTPNLMGPLPETYAQKLRNRLHWAYAKAQEVNEKEKA